MEVELRRHDWAALRSFVGGSGVLLSALRDLVSASTDADAEAAFQRIEGVTVVQGRLSESSSAVAHCLVHALWRANEASVEKILELLSIISGGHDEWAVEEGVGPISYHECMDSITLGFPAYCEILEKSASVERKLSCIDLVQACGLHDPKLQGPAVAALEAALDSEVSDRTVSLISASIREIVDRRN